MKTHKGHTVKLNDELLPEWFCEGDQVKRLKMSARKITEGKVTIVACEVTIKEI